MTFQEILDSIGISQGAFWTGLFFLASFFIEWRPEIKWNPWSSLIKWIGTRFNSKVNANIDEKIKLVQGDIQVLDKKVDYLQGEVNKVQNDLTGHIKESEIKSLEDTRRDILDFSNACMNKRKHTQEQFRFILKRCDEYEKYIEKNHLKNGEIKNAIEEIRRLHKKCLQDNTFLKEGEGDHDE